jgi:hypothetical protein
MDIQCQLDVLTGAGATRLQGVPEAGWGRQAGTVFLLRFFN